MEFFIQNINHYLSFLEVFLTFSGFIVLIFAFSMIKSIYTKEINKEHDCRLIRAAEWYFLSLVEPDLEMSLIMGVICLEALLGETEQDVSITSRLSDRCSFLLAENIIERKQIKDDIKYHYCPNVCYDSVL